MRALFSTGTLVIVSGYDYHGRCCTMGRGLSGGADMGGGEAVLFCQFSPDIIVKMNENGLSSRMPLHEVGVIVFTP